jgi:hypothetical protein
LIPKEEENETSFYNGVRLNKEDSIVLQELENLIGEKLTGKSIGFYRSGFVHNNQAITGLSLRKKNFHYLPESIGDLAKNS